VLGGYFKIVPNPQIHRVSIKAILKFHM
jgi:hypothetical protein